MNRPGTKSASSAESAESHVIAAYGRLLELLLDEPDVDDFLEHVAATAATLVSGTSCGVTLRRDHHIVAIANDEFALQFAEGQRVRGPGLETLRTGKPVVVNDLADDVRWSDYMAIATAAGLNSVLAVPLTLEGATVATLCHYSRARHSFDAATRRQVQQFAWQTSMTLTLLRRSEVRTVRHRQMLRAIVVRATIDQALGILMAQRGLSSGDALESLRETSQHTNEKLSSVAAGLIEAVTGRPPDPPRPYTERD